MSAVAFIENGRFEAEVLDGKVISIRNLNSPVAGNLAEAEPFLFGSLAFVFGDHDGPTAKIIFDSPGDIDRKSDSTLQAKIDDWQRKHGL